MSEGGGGFTIESEVRARTRTDVMIIGGDVADAGRLRVAIRESGSLQLVEDVASGSAAALAAGLWQPGYIVVATDEVGESFVDYVRAIRAASESSRFLVCADRFEPWPVVELCRLKVQGFLDWTDVTTEMMDATIAALGANLYVFSGAASRALDLALDEARFFPRRKLKEHERAGLLRLTEREKAVMREMCRWKTQRQAARSLGIPLRTFERVVHQAKEKLGVHTLFQLGMWAYCLSLLDAESRE